MTTYCANHPTLETGLRCNQCDKYICSRCAVKTPTGYRCPECVRGQQKKFETAQWYDYLLAFMVPGFLSFVASLLVSMVGTAGFFAWFVLIAASPTAGVIIAEATRYVTNRHRSKRLYITAAVAAALGALPMVILFIFFFDVFGIIFQLIYLVLAVPALYTRLSGIQINP